MQIMRSHKITGWRRNQRLPGKPDFVFRQAHLAVFVDGCFWHGCRQHLRMPRANRDYWARKIGLNKNRDRMTVRALRDAGWQAVRIWEHELRFPARVAKRLKKALRPDAARTRISRGSRRRL